VSSSPTARPDGGPPAAAVTREELHHRRIDMRGFRRSDGLFELEGRVTDRKPVDFAPPSDVRVIPAGAAIHDMGVRLVFDEAMVVREVSTFIDAWPYADCPGGGASLQALVGLPITGGWAAEVRKRLPTSETCTHLREILLPMASAAFQAMTVTRLEQPPPVDTQGRPAQLNSCYAYGSDRQIVARRWPQFARKAPSGG
jgi:Protein of unknown function (DUF2889)